MGEQHIQNTLSVILDQQRQIWDLLKQFHGDLGMLVKDVEMIKLELQDSVKTQPKDLGIQLMENPMSVKKIQTEPPKTYREWIAQLKQHQRDLLVVNDMVQYVTIGLKEQVEPSAWKTITVSLEALGFTWEKDKQLWVKKRLG